MTRDWDDILAQPIARLKPDLPAADGGWRAVRPLEGMSPRPQQPPLTLPEGDSMLSVRVPMQTEDRAPSAPPPASLTDQLSLTWANRKVRSRGAEEAPAGPHWPEATRTEPSAPQPEAPPRPAPALLRPFQGIARVLRREAPRAVEAPVPAPQAAPTRPELPKQEPSPPRAQPHDAPPSEPASPKPAMDGGTSLPLTLATRAEPEHSPAAVPPPVAAPAAPAAAKEPERAQRSDGILRNLLRRDGPAERPHPATGSVTAGPPPPSPAAATQPERALPLVHRAPAAAPEPPTSAPQTSFDAAPPPARPTSGPAASQASAPSAEPPDSGETLSPVLRARMEGLVDVPLREVRVFRNSVSRQVTSSQKADAVTVDQQVHMAPGKGNGSTPSGQALLAHELSHVADGLTAPASRRSPTPQQEARAQAVEQMVQRQAESPFPLPKPQAPDMRLEHRQTPAPAPAPQAFPAAPVAASQGGLAGIPAPASRSSGGPMVLARAPVNRLPDAAAPHRAAPATPAPATLMSGSVEVKRAEQDEATMVARVVDAVMRRLRREGALERERRGAFRSEIGG